MALDVIHPHLFVTGFGLVTSLGFGNTACAAARAGAIRRRPLDIEVLDAAASEMVPVQGHAAGAWTLGFAEAGRLVTLTRLALSDLLERTPLSDADLANTAVLLNLGSGFHLAAAEAHEKQRHGEPPPGTTSQADRFESYKPLYDSIVNKAFRGLGRPAPPRQKVIYGDQDGIGELIVLANQLLEHRVVHACIVGGVDSLLESRWLESLNTLGILKTPVTAIGLSPGEAAAFLLLENHQRPVRSENLAMLSAAARARENGHRFSDPRPVGRMLAKTMAAGAAGAQRFGVITDLNGDGHRATEFGYALVTNNSGPQLAETIVPAINFGETRAASAFVGACVGLRAFARGYARSSRFVVSSSSDSGGRAAVTLDAIQ